MSNNTVTFFQAESPPQSMRVVPVAVEVDGLGAPWLELLEISRDTGTQLNQARLRVAGHPLGPTVRFEGIASVAQPGQSIRASYVAPANPAGRQQLLWPLFAGVICEGHASLDDDKDGLAIIARDELTYRDGTVVAGMRVLAGGGDTVFVSASEAIFNPDGSGNCSGAAMVVAGRSRHVFELNPAKADYWTYARAIRYIAMEYMSIDAITSSTLAALETMTADQILRDVDITGLTPIKAVGRLCERAGLQYYLVHAPLADGQSIATLQFYRHGKGRRVFLRHQGAGGRLDLSQTNVASCSLRSDHTRQPIQLRGRGGRKRYEATFALVPGWAAALEENDYDRYSASTNEHFLEVQDVFRKWVLNEAGDYSAAPFNRGDPTDLSGVFGDDNYARRRRRFWPCLSCGASGKSLGYYLEVSYDNGAYWQQYIGAFDNLLDECGIYLSGNQLDPELWSAVVAGTLALRITAAIDGDSRLEVTVNDAPVSGIRPVRSKLLDLGHEFKYRQVSSSSIFHDNSTTELGEPDLADDSVSMRGLLRDHLNRIRQERLSGRTVLPWVHPDIWPGDTVTGIEGRDVDFRWRRHAGEYAPQVQKVVLSFGREWTTAITFG